MIRSNPKPKSHPADTRDLDGAIEAISEALRDLPEETSAGNTLFDAGASGSASVTCSPALRDDLDLATSAYRTAAELTHHLLPEWGSLQTLFANALMLRFRSSRAMG